MKKSTFVLMMLVLVLALTAFIPVSAENEEKAAAINEAKASLADLYEMINPSVLYIEVSKKEGAEATTEYGNPLDDFNFDWGDLFGPEFQQFFEQYMEEDEEEEDSPVLEDDPEGQDVVFGSGTGFVWDTEGHVVTNNHVIEGASKVTVTYSDGLVRDAEVIGTDPDSDLAVLLVKDFKADVAPVVMGDSTSIRPGDLVAAIGNPLGQNGTMTAGIVSALHRSFSVDNGDQNGHYTIPDMIQTDASINPGNSGGVLINLDGEVIGVVNSFSSYSYSSAGIGYAIPANLAKRVVPAMIENGVYEHPWIGMSGIALSPVINEVLGLEHDQRGAYIQSVTEGSPAEAAGVKGGDHEEEIAPNSKISVGGDIVTKINERDVLAMDDVIAYLSSNTSVGDTITLHVIRDGEEMDIDLTLAARPTAAERSAAAKETDEDEKPAGSAYLGAYVKDVDKNTIAELGLPEGTEGVLVTDVSENSPAEIAGLVGGSDVITAINGEPVTSVKALKEEIAKYMPGEVVTFTVIREGEEQQIKLILGNSLSK